MRLKRVAYLLLHGNDSVAEIAYQVGFNSPSYFTRWLSRAVWCVRRQKIS
jgi:AraC-like DNA-binding protein